MTGSGLLAGAAGGVALFGFDRLEATILGRPAVYAPAEIVRRLGERPYVPQPPPARVHRLGEVARVMYSEVLGSLFRRAPGGPLLRPALFGTLVALGESVMLPLSGATPPWREWSSGEKALLFVHALAFAATAQLALSWSGHHGRRAAAR